MIDPFYHADVLRGKTYDALQQFNCGVELRQNKYGTYTRLIFHFSYLINNKLLLINMYYLMNFIRVHLTGKSLAGTNARQNRPDIFRSTPRSIYIDCFYPHVDLVMNPAEGAKGWDRYFEKFSRKMNLSEIILYA